MSGQTRWVSITVSAESFEFFRFGFARCVPAPETSSFTRVRRLAWMLQRGNRGAMPTNMPPDPKTIDPKTRERPVVQPSASPAKTDPGADQDTKAPEREKRIERFRER